MILKVHIKIWYSKIQVWLSTPLQGWTDVDWGGYVDSSLIYFCMWYNHMAHEKQATITLSFTKACIASTLQSTLQFTIQELDILQIFKFKLQCDNLSCVKIMKNPKITNQNQHIRARYHFMIELVEAHNLDINYTPIHDMWTNFLTKPIQSIKHQNYCKYIGLSLSH